MKGCELGRGIDYNITVNVSYCSKMHIYTRLCVHVCDV